MGNLGVCVIGQRLGVWGDSVVLRLSSTEQKDRCCSCLPQREAMTVEWKSTWKCCPNFKKGENSSLRRESNSVRCNVKIKKEEWRQGF